MCCVHLIITFARIPSMELIHLHTGGHLKEGDWSHCLGTSDGVLDGRKLASQFFQLTEETNEKKIIV